MLRLRRLAAAGLELEDGAFRIHEIGGAVMTDWKPMSRVFGFDFESLARLDEILAWYEEAGRSPHFELLPLENNDALFAEMAARGFGLKYMISVLWRELDAGFPDPADASVRVSPDGEIRDWVDVYIDGHDWTCTDEERPRWIAELSVQYVAPGITRHVATLDGEIAAIAASYAHGDGHGHLTNCATLPRFRGRGLHGALIRRRLAALAACGVTVVAADTRPYSISQRNLERAGLELAYQKLHFKRA